ncbi:MAG TPA: hypothetical protein VFF81_05055 [Noviherbaspirillum sp.]|nr:hypothetical protein [Noviherbaspirillum sp.]
MRNLLLLFHLVFAGLWLGCVLTEVLFERALLGRGKDYEVILAGLHRRVDLFVEIPAFLAVLVTGALMVANVNPGPVLHTKIAFGVLAIAANIYCVSLVLRRAKAATEGHWEEFARLDHLQHKFGAVVLLGILAALGIGGYLFSYA